MKKYIISALISLVMSANAGTNTYVALPTNSATYLPPAAYVSNALVYAQQFYPEEMRQTNDFPYPANATLLIGDDVKPEDKDNIHVNFLHIIGYADATKTGDNPFPYEDIRVELDKKGALIRHTKTEGSGYVGWIKLEKER